MQLVEGQPLDRLIPQDGLPVEQIVEIAERAGRRAGSGTRQRHRAPRLEAGQCNGYERWPRQGIGLRAGQGCSRLRPGNATMTSANRTEAGMVMGTPAYMSPEQTSGRPLDHRTDIFSLGIMLHEMATGRRPFDGTSSAELISAILRDTPPSVTDLRSDLPGDLARIVRRCLEKDPRHRLQTARDVSNEFRDMAREISHKTGQQDFHCARRGCVPGSGACAPTKASGLRCCPSNTAAETPK